MRKAIALLLVGFLLVGILGCGGNAKPDPKAAAAAAKTDNLPDPPETTFKNKRR